MKTSIIALVILAVLAIIGFFIWSVRSPAAGTTSQASIEQAAPSAQNATTTFEGYYQTETTDLYTEVNISIIPTRLNGESINGIEIVLRDQTTSLPEPYQVIINANITGELQKEWTCDLISNKTIVHCSGTQPLALNETTTLALYFAHPPALPQTIRIRLLSGATTVAAEDVPRQD